VADLHHAHDLLVVQKFNQQLRPRVRASDDKVDFTVLEGCGDVESEADHSELDPQAWTRRDDLGNNLGKQRRGDDGLQIADRRIEAALDLETSDLRHDFGHRLTHFARARSVGTICAPLRTRI